MNTKDMLITVVIGIIVFTFAVYVINDILTMPDVYFSYSTNECVKVINYGTDYTCENLPEKFNHVWVQ